MKWEARIGQWKCQHRAYSVLSSGRFRSLRRVRYGAGGMGSLADYIAVLALSQSRNFDACWEVPSITNLLSKDCAPGRKTATLSDNDAAFLHGLYKMGAGDSVWAQRSEIRYFIERRAAGK